jgi:FkbM family methyltransferase
MIEKSELLELINDYAGIPRKQTIIGVSLGDFVLDVPDSASFLSQVREIFYEREYDFITKSKKPVILDVGSNIGMSCLFFSKIYPDSLIYSYEADPFIFEFLKNNIKNNNIYNVELNNVAAWYEESELFFDSKGTDAGHVSKDKGKLKVKAVDFCQQMHRFDTISLLKIDIEGSETSVFPHIASQLHKVDNLILEYHSSLTEKQFLSTILQIIENNGFRYHIHQVNRRKSPLKNKLPKGLFDCQVNIFAYKQKDPLK